MQVIELFQSSPLFFAITALIFGLLVGSFLNVIIYRYPIMLFREWCGVAKEILEEHGYQVSGKAANPQVSDTSFNFVFPRSRCPSCSHLIRSWENIPVLSYLFQRGKCTQCKNRISLRYPIIELLTGVAFCWIAFTFGWTWLTLLYLTVTALLIVQIFIDIDHKILPDPINYILLWLALLASATGMTISLYDSVIGALAGYLSLWSFYWVYKLLTKKEGMGYGDFKLLAAIGALTGWQYLLVIIILSSAVGAVFGITMMLRKKADSNSQIPFGPYLAIAGWITIFWGQPIISYYFHISGIS